MQRSNVFRSFSAVAVLALAAACGGGDSPSGPNPPTPVPPTPSPSPDTQAPTVSYVAPAADTTVAQSGVTVQGQASDNVGVSRVTYTLDGGTEREVAITAATSVTFDLTVQNLSEGSHTLVLRAYDAAANQAEAQRGVTYLRPAAYTLAQIALLPGTGSAIPAGIANGPIVVGIALDGAGRRFPFYWRQGQLSALPLLPGHATGQANGVNSAGQAVGYSTTSSDAVVNPGEVFRAVLWQNGTVSDLGDLGGGLSLGFGINADGVVVGASTRGAGSGAPFLPFIRENGSMRELPGLGGTGGFATAVNRVGQAVGSAVNAAGQRRAVLWQNDQATDLGAIAGDGQSIARGINDAGQVVGYSGLATGTQRAFRWENGTTTELGSLAPGGATIANAINQAGTVVGTTAVGGSAVGFVFAGGKMTNLNDLVSSGSGFTIVVGTGIDDDGEILAEGVKANGERRAVILTASNGSAASAYRVRDVGALPARAAQPFGGMLPQMDRLLIGDRRSR